MTPQHTTGATATGPLTAHERQWRITAVATLRIDEAQAQESFAGLKASLPSRTARRMSRTGLMLARLLEHCGIGEDVSVIYGSTFAEGRTLESYLESFPQASPLGFQSSIHPGGIEQALILRQQPVREFFPLADDGALPLAMLRTLLLCATPGRALLLGAEECGTWLAQHDLASVENFAFALAIEPATPTAPTQTGAAQLGTLSYRQANQTGHHSPCEQPAAASQPHSQANQLHPQTSAGNRSAQSSAHVLCSLSQLCDALAARQPLHLPHPDGGCWTLEWSNGDSDAADTPATATATPHTCGSDSKGETMPSGHSPPSQSA